MSYRCLSGCFPACASTWRKHMVISAIMNNRIRLSIFRFISCKETYFSRKIPEVAAGICVVVRQFAVTWMRPEDLLRQPVRDERGRGRRSDSPAQVLRNSRSEFRLLPLTKRGYGRAKHVTILFQTTWQDDSR